MAWWGHQPCDRSPSLYPSLWDLLVLPSFRATGPRALLCCIWQLLPISSSQGTQSPAFICWQKRVLSVSEITWDISLYMRYFPYEKQRAHNKRLNISCKLLLAMPFLWHNMQCNPTHSQYCNWKYYKGAVGWHTPNSQIKDASRYLPHWPLWGVLHHWSFLSPSLPGSWDTTLSWFLSHPSNISFLVPISGPPLRSCNLPKLVLGLPFSPLIVSLGNLLHIKTFWYHLYSAGSPAQTVVLSIRTM